MTWKTLFTGKNMKTMTLCHLVKILPSMLRVTICFMNMIWRDAKDLLNFHVLGLNVSLDEVDFGKELESLVGIGDLSATKTGDCANFNLQVTFESLPGDLSEMTVSDGDLTGIDASASVSTDVNGGLYYDPLTGDMLSTVETTPQVRVYINDVPTKCSGDCSFQWDSSVTPTVTSVSPTSGKDFALYHTYPAVLLTSFRKMFFAWHFILNENILF